MQGAVSPFSSSPHRDVLEAAVPEDVSGRDRLLAELKDRARAAIGAGQYPDAAALYNKALQVVGVSAAGEGDKAKTAERSILHANLSLVQGKMSHWQAARDEADLAVAADPLYVKGWWRLGQARGNLGLYGDAVSALERGLALEPDNKALKKEFDRMKEKQKQSKQKKTVSSTTTKSSSSNSHKSTINNKSKTAKRDSSATPMEVDNDDEDDPNSGATFTKSDHVKGYKIVNGKKTSYFHNELDEETAALIGDIAPKKLEAAETAATAPTTTTATTTSSSAWNKAGTWEEKDVTLQAKEMLQQKLVQVKYELPSSSDAAGATVTVSDASVSGHASVATVRGKRKYLYEWSAKLSWEFRRRAAVDAPADATGTLRFPDVDGTVGADEEFETSDFEIRTTTTTGDGSTVRPVLERFVRREGFRSAADRAIHEWVEQFRETFA